MCQDSISHWNLTATVNDTQSDCCSVSIKLVLKMFLPWTNNLDKAGSVVLNNCWCAAVFQRYRKCDSLDLETKIQVIGHSDNQGFISSEKAHISYYELHIQFNSITFFFNYIFATQTIWLDEGNRMSGSPNVGLSNETPVFQALGQRWAN